jgi:hypothetical protein
VCSLAVSVFCVCSMWYFVDSDDGSDNEFISLSDSLFLHIVIVCLGLAVYLYGLCLHLNLLAGYLFLCAVLWFYVALVRAFSASCGGAALPIGSRWGLVLGVCVCRVLGFLGDLGSAGLPVIVLVVGTD